METPPFTGKIQLCCTDHHQIADHPTWYGFIGKSVIGCPDSFFDGPVVSLGFGYMIVGICVVHDYIEVVSDLIHHRLIFSITMDCLDHEASLIAMMQSGIECSIVVLVLLGIHWYQAPELDSSDK